jgi:hypothetical protein
MAHSSRADTLKLGKESSTMDVCLWYALNAGFVEIFIFIFIYFFRYQILVENLLGPLHTRAKSHDLTL